METHIDWLNQKIEAAKLQQLTVSTQLRTENLREIAKLSASWEVSLREYKDLEGALPFDVDECIIKHHSTHSKS